MTSALRLTVFGMQASCTVLSNLEYLEILCNKETRQGCNMSPTLFKLYLNDLHEEFMRDGCDRVKACDQVTGCVFYADDLVILRKNAHELQNSLDNLTTYCEKWRLTVNVRETKIMVYICHETRDIFTLNNETVRANQVCYLRFILISSEKTNATVKYVHNYTSRSLFLFKVQM